MNKSTAKAKKVRMSLRQARQPEPTPWFLTSFTTGELVELVLQRPQGLT